MQTQAKPASAASVVVVGAARRGRRVLALLISVPLVVLAGVAVVIGSTLLIDRIFSPDFSKDEAQTFFDERAPGAVRVYGCEETTVVYEPAWACAVSSSDPRLFGRLGITRSEARVSVAVVCFDESGVPQGLGFPGPQDPCGPAET